MPGRSRPTARNCQWRARRWLGQLSDALLAQSAIDRLKLAFYEVVLVGESCRHREKPGLLVSTTAPDLVPAVTKVHFWNG